jgi:hypothetical protein
MKKTQAGISAIGAAVIAAVVAGGGAGAVAWQQHQQLTRVRGELAESQVAVQTANASANAARTQLAAVRKELDEQKMAFEQVRAELNSARVLFEAEKQHGERLRAELTLAKEQLAFMRTRQMPAYPSAAEPRVIRVAPAYSRPQAVGVGSPVQGQAVRPQQGFPGVTPPR